MTSARPDPGLAALLEKLARDRGFAGEAYKQGCIRRRVAVRMRARGVHTYDQYAQLLDADPAEYDRLLDALTINVTKFFRNRETWERVSTRVLPALWELRRGLMRCWSVGCASGEEPYTLAILLLEHARAHPGLSTDGARIDATDLDRASLDRADTGVYQAGAFDEMPRALLSRYFTPEPPRALRAEVKRLVRFRHHDVLSAEPPQPPYDLIVCRNVVIYFDRPTQERLFLTFVNALDPGGYLVLGKVETLYGEARNRLDLEDARERIYRRP